MEELYDSLHENTEEFLEQLHAYALYLTHDCDTANDLCQETVLRILNRLNKYDERGRLIAWAKTVMRNLFINRLRDNQIHARLFIDGYDDAERQAMPFATPECESDYREQEIHCFIDSLPERQHRAIDLRVAGYRYDEIAEEMRIATGTVKNEIFEARKKLKKWLEE